MLFYGCRSDDELIVFPCEETEICEDFPPPLGLTNWVWEKQYPYYFYPCFNPNNADEILFCEDRLESEQVISSIIRYNLVTKERQLIFEGRVGPRPRWGRNDWILLNLFDGNNFDVFKIQSNGENLTQLTFSGNCFYPEWDEAGERIIYELGFTSPTQFIIMNKDGVVLDSTLVGVGPGGSWQHDSLIVNGNFRGLFVGNPSSDLYDYEMLSNVEPNSQSAGGAEWVDDENAIWTHTSGVYSTNVITQETTLLKETCNSDYYELPTFSEQLDKVILQRKCKTITSREVDNNKGTSTSNLFMMSTDGTDETLIRIN